MYLFINTEYNLHECGILLMRTFSSFLEEILVEKNVFGELKLPESYSVN